ncbi:MAG: hypothetical protein QW514_07570 [Thermoprotei archaeon]
MGAKGSLHAISNDLKPCSNQDTRLRFIQHPKTELCVAYTASYFTNNSQMVLDVVGFTKFNGNKRRWGGTTHFYGVFKFLSACTSLTTGPQDSMDHLCTKSSNARVSLVYVVDVVVGL